MADKEKDKKEKPLDKMTAKELREVALTIEGISGVHAMNKNELIDAIKEARGIVEDKTKTKAKDVRALKAKAKELKEKKLQAKEAGDRKQVDQLRKQINRLKKKMRREA